MSDKKPTVTALDQELVDALNEKEAEARQLLDISDDKKPAKVVSKIRKFVDQLLSEDRSEEEMHEYALQFGALWGAMLCEEYDWQWKYLDFGDDVKGIYLVSPKKYYCCPPLYFMNKILGRNNPGLDGENDNTIMLLFNMIKDIEKQKPAEKYQIIS